MAIHYQARGCGTVKIKNTDRTDLVEILEKTKMAFGEDCDLYEDQLFLNHPMDDYFEEEIHDFLKSITPFTDSGEINFEGEDDTIWRFVFSNGEWKEQRGRIVYESVDYNERHSDRLELLGTLTDIVEDYLEKKGITKEDIPSEDREDDSDNYFAIIYGKDYDELTGRFEKVLIESGLLEEREK